MNPVQICRGIIQSSEKGSFEYVRLRFLRQRVLRPDAKGGDGDLEMQETALYLYKVVHLPPILLIDPLLVIDAKYFCLVLSYLLLENFPPKYRNFIIEVDLLFNIYIYIEFPIYKKI